MPYRAKQAVYYCGGVAPQEPPRKRERGTPTGAANGNRSSYSNGSSSHRSDADTSPRSSTKIFSYEGRAETSSPPPRTFGPRQTPFQGPRGVKLSFNYWVRRETSHQNRHAPSGKSRIYQATQLRTDDVHYRESADTEPAVVLKVMTSDVRKLVMATLADEPAPDFAEKIPGAGKVVIASVTGLRMTAAEACLEAGVCPFLRSCSSVPVRNSFEPSRGGYPRASDVQSGAALMLWGEKPTLPRKEIASMSLTKLFNECEVTFAGIKSLGWRDDLSFYPSSDGTPPSVPEDRSLSPSGDEAKLKSQGGVANRKGDGSEGTQPVCRGKFVRNFNRDSGRFTLSVEEDDKEPGDVVWVLRLNWDRWDTEVVYLKEDGKLLRFEDKEQSLSLNLSYARRLTEQERQAAHQEPGALTSAPSLDVKTIDAPSSLAAATASNPAIAPESAAIATAPEAQGDGRLKRKAPEADEAHAGAGKEIIVEIKTPAESPVRISLGSLDPEAYCLRVMDRYRLRIPFRVSGESSDYVSTDEPMSPSRPREDGDGGSLAMQRAGGDEDSGALESSRGGDSGDMEIDAAGVGDKGGVRRHGEPWSMRQDRDEEKKYEDEEEGEIDEEEEEGAIMSPIPTSSTGHAPPPQEGGAKEIAASVNEPGKRKIVGGEVGDRGLETSGEDKSEAEEEGEVEPNEASISTGANGVMLETDSANLVEGEDGATVVPTPSSGVGDGGGSCGRESSAPSTRTFVPPLDDLLCPIPSGPAKGAVILGLDCEMVYTKEGLELARVTLVNVKRQIVYDELVKPKRKVTDFNTQFSGITPKMLRGVRRTLRDAQYEILTFVGVDTYLVGHSLESDLRALKIVHRRLIDTSELYPSARGAPFKNGLRMLSQTMLGREIQGSEDGHDSGEDAIASLELALLKIHRGPSFGLPPVWATKMNPPKESLFESLECRKLGPLSCKVCGDLEARASAEYPALPPVWSVFNSGYRREQDAVWAARRFGESKADASGGEASPEAVVTKVTVDAPNFSTAGDIFQDALESLPAAPSLLWLDLPCKCSDFDRGDESTAATIWAAERRRENSVAIGGNGPSGEQHWKSLVEIDSAMARVYDTMAKGTLLVVVCQGAISHVVTLLARRTRSKWDVMHLEKNDYIAGQKRALTHVSTFDRQDEEDLAKATSDCLDGMCFLAVK